MIHDLTPTALDSPPGTPEFMPGRRPACAGHLPGCAGHLFDGFDMTLHDFIVFGSSIWVRRLAFDELDLTLHDFDEFDLTLHDFNEFDMTLWRLDLVSM